MIVRMVRYGVVFYSMLCYRVAYSTSTGML